MFFLRKKPGLGKASASMHVRVCTKREKTHAKTLTILFNVITSCVMSLKLTGYRSVSN